MSLTGLLLWTAVFYVMSFCHMDLIASIRPSSALHCVAIFLFSTVSFLSWISTEGFLLGSHTHWWLRECRWNCPEVTWRCSACWEYKWTWALSAFSSPVDITLYRNGYHGDLNETFFVGDVDEGARKLVQTTYECLMQAVDAGQPSMARTAAALRWTRCTSVQRSSMTCLRLFTSFFS